MLRISTVFILIILFLMGCDRDIDITAPSTNSSVNFYFSKPASIDSLVVYARAMVSAPDMDTIIVDLTVNPNSVTGTIENIPAGPHRKFEIFTYDADSILTYYGYTFADVPPGTVLNLQITLYPVNNTGTVIIVGTFASFPAGEKIVFRANYTGTYDLYMMNANASNIINLTNTPNIDEKYARISPDRKKIIFTRQETNGIMRPYLMDIDGKNITPLNILPGSHIGFCDWSPNGQQLVFNSNYDGDAEIYTYDFNTGYTTQLTFNYYRDWVPQWSPTGEWIAYQSDETGLFKIYLIHPDGSGKHLLHPDIQLEEKFPSFSPDGKKILFYGRNGYATWDLFISDINGANLVRLTNTPGIDENYGCWSPDGRKILFTLFDGVNKGLYIFNLDGMSIYPFLDNPDGYEEFPHWR